ncbi:MAG: zinc ribbon domain-containing protein [Planctomycetota bacterium]|nr:MAG: zinc ribbon domain-containing protein [Planctomycetota bacterium]
MPTYEYLCANCGYELEQFQAITAKALRKCPNCGRKELRRLIGTGAGVIFKGSGFYQTDYRSESYKEAEKSEKGTGDTKKKEPKKKGEDKKPKEKSETGNRDEKEST